MTGWDRPASGPDEARSRLGLKVAVTGHARQRLRERRPDWAHRSTAELDALIAHQVRLALLSGRASERKPKHWLLPGERRRDLGGSWFVWDKADTFGWVIREGTAREVTVITSLNRVLRKDGKRIAA